MPPTGTGATADVVLLCQLRRKTDVKLPEIAMRYRQDILVLNGVRNNQSYHHAAYRQYILWQHWKVKKGN